MADVFDVLDTPAERKAAAASLIPSTVDRYMEDGVLSSTRIESLNRLYSYFFGGTPPFDTDIQSLPWTTEVDIDSVDLDGFMAGLREPEQADAAKTAFMLAALHGKVVEQERTASYEPFLAD